MKTANDFVAAGAKHQHSLSALIPPSVQNWSADRSTSCMANLAYYLIADTDYSHGFVMENWTLIGGRAFVITVTVTKWHMK